MPTLYRNGVSPAHQHFASSLPFPPPLLHPLGYVVESRQNHRRREIDSLKDLRKEIQAVKHRERLFVIHNRDPRVLEVLGIDASPARTWAGEGLGEWTWEYPHAQEDNRLTFRVVSLYARDDGHWTLLIDPPRREQSGFRPLPPRLKHQDAATRASALRTASHYGVSLGSTTSLDENLCKVFDGEEPLPEALGELVFGRWLDLLSSLSSRDCPRMKERILYKALRSLERNEDLVRLLGKKSQSLSTPSREDMTDLLNRLHRHMQLLLPPRPQASPTTTTNASSSAASDRALNRISYIGGLLLPVTVVSSVLAIEGDYGPEGNNFWVFWVASVVASVVAVGLIHIDEVRGVEVWREVAEEIGILGADDEAGEGDGDGDNGSVRDGHGLVWERRQLGWGGAVKKVSGYYRLRGTKGLKFDRPDGR